uniref:Tpd52 like 1 n=1 Tax=Stegastes partitus TaxID=144197 RepID=A0A3B5ANN1_9TELE
MESRQTGFLDSEPLQEADEDLVSEVNLSTPMMTEEEREEIQQELAKLEEEINTLKQVLTSKERQHAELKQKLGLGPLSEFRTNFSRGWHDMQTSTAYKKTSETLSTAGQKTSAAFSNLGSAITRKFGDMSMAGLELLFPRRYVPTVCPDTSMFALIWTCCGHFSNSCFLTFTSQMMQVCVESVLMSSTETHVRE